MPYPAMQLLAAGASNWYDDWQDAFERAKASNGQAHIVHFGDSLSQGFYATEPYYLNGFAGRVGTELAARTGQDAGTGLIPAYEEFTITDGRTSSAGTWVSNTSGGLFSRNRVASDSGDTYTLGPITCSAFKIMYLTDGSGGAWTATIDSGTPANYTSNGAGTVELVEIDAGGLGSHTLVIAGSGTLYLVAVEAVRNPTTGVKVSRLALSGAECSQLTADGSTISSRDCYLLTNPDLAIIEFGLNEASNATTTATFKTNMGTLITDMQTLGASVLIVAAPPPNTTFISGATWDTFRVAMEELSVQYGTGFLDMADYWTSYVANNPYYFDDVHPNDGGHADMASILAGFVVDTVSPSPAITFVPTDISNLAAWYDASHAASFTYSSGTLVSQWNDRSANARHLTQGTAGNQPTRSASVNGLGAVWFDGVDNVLGGGDVIDLGTDSISVFAVVKFNTIPSSNGRTIIGKYKVNPSDGSWILLLAYNASAKLQAIYDAGTVATAESTTFSATTPKLIGTIIDRAAGSITNRVSKATDGTTTFTPDDGSSRNIVHELWVGALRNSANSGFQSGYWHNGYICEIVVYTKALNSTERDQVEAYLDTKWGLL
jgi:lysophospholipase L1-like esterase